MGAMPGLRRFQDVVLCFRDQLDERLRELQMSQMPLVSRVGADRLWQTRRVLLVSPAGAEWSEAHLEEAAHTVTLGLRVASIAGSEEQASAVANAAADLANQVEGGTIRLLGESLTKAGRSFDKKGQPLTASDLAAYLESTEIRFDADGQGEMTIFGGDAAMKQFQRIFSDPKETEIVNAAIERARERWRVKWARVLRSYGKRP